MKVYRYVADADGYDCLETYRCLEPELDLRMLEKGKPIRDSWQAPSIPYYACAGHSGDFPAIPFAIPVFSERAWKALQPLIHNQVEPLPIIVDREVHFSKKCDRQITAAGPYGPYLAINVLNIIDCIDKSRSDIRRIVGGVVIHVASYAFLPGTITNNDHIFKTPETASLEVLVSETFKNVVEGNSLRGAYFVELGLG